MVSLGLSGFGESDQIEFRDSGLTLCGLQTACRVRLRRSFTEDFNLDWAAHVAFARAPTTLIIILIRFEPMKEPDRTTSRPVAAMKVNTRMGGFGV